MPSRFTIRRFPPAYLIIAATTIPAAAQTVEVDHPAVPHIRQALQRRTEPVDLTIEYEKRMHLPPAPDRFPTLMSHGFARRGKGLGAADARAHAAMDDWTTTGLEVLHSLRVDLAGDGSARVEKVNDYVGVTDAPPAERITTVHVRTPADSFWSWDSRSRVVFAPGVPGANQEYAAFHLQEVEDAEREARQVIDPAGGLKSRLREARLTAISPRSDDGIVATFIDGPSNWTVEFERIDDQWWICGALFLDGNGSYVQQRWSNDRPLGAWRIPTKTEYWSGPAEECDRDERPASMQIEYRLVNARLYTNDDEKTEHRRVFHLPAACKNAREQIRLRYTAVTPAPRTMLRIAPDATPNRPKEQ